MYLIIIFFDFTYNVFVFCVFDVTENLFVVTYLFSFCFVASDVMSAAKSMRKNTCA